jgi:hypothetical protein
VDARLSAFPRVLCVCVCVCVSSFRVRSFHSRCDQLREAAGRGDLGTVRRLAEEGADVNAANSVSLHHIVGVCSLLSLFPVLHSLVHTEELQHHDALRSIIAWPLCGARVCSTVCRVVVCCRVVYSCVCVRVAAHPVHSAPLSLLLHRTGGRRSCWLLALDSSPSWSTWPARRERTSRPSTPT